MGHAWLQVPALKLAYLSATASGITRGRPRGGLPHHPCTGRVLPLLRLAPPIPYSHMSLALLVPPTRGLPIHRALPLLVLLPASLMRSLVLPVPGTLESPSGSPWASYWLHIPSLQRSPAALELPPYAICASIREPTPFRFFLLVFTLSLLLMALLVFCSLLGMCLLSLTPAYGRDRNLLTSVNAPH